MYIMQPLGPIEFIMRMFRPNEKRIPHRFTIMWFVLMLQTVRVYGKYLWGDFLPKFPFRFLHLFEKFFLV